MSVTDEVIDDIDRVHQEVVDAVRACSDQAWTSRTATEGWQLGVVARHIGLGWLLQRRWIESLAAGEPITMTMDEIHEGNEANRAAEADSKDQTLAFLDKAHSRLVEAIRKLGDEPLDRSVYFGPANREVKAADVARLSTAHAQGHLASITATAGATT